MSKKSQTSKLESHVVVGDCLKVIGQLEDQSVDLIYLDPPFFTQTVHASTSRKGDEIFQFSDKWSGGLDQYLGELTKRLRLAHAKLKLTGSLFLHCDPTASHYLKVELDKIFGAGQFRSEIIWSFKRWSNSKKGLLNNHQVIFFYSRTKDFKFNKFYEDYSLTTNLDQIVQKRTRDFRNKSTYLMNGSGKAELVSFKNGVPLGDVWNIPFLNPKARERVGYPTQKPVLLLEKIIKLVTDEGDLVFDPYCGSGSTLVAAKILKRKYIGCDLSKMAVELAKKRLNNPIKTDSKLLKVGIDAYETQSAETKLILKKLSAKPVKRSKSIDGLIATKNGLAPLKISTLADIYVDAEKLKEAINKKGFKTGFIYLNGTLQKKEKSHIERQFNIKIVSQFD